MLNKRTCIIDGNNGTARHLKEILEANKDLSESNEEGNIIFLNSYNEEKYIELSKKLFNLI